MTEDTRMADESRPAAVGGDRVQRRDRLARARLYLCTDGRERQGDLPAFLDAVLSHGVDVVQLRQKGLEAEQELDLLAVFADACRRHGALLAVNDRADLARLAGADVLHLGQRDLTPAQARQVVGDEVLIGRSTHHLAQAQRAADDPEVDYLCAGPVWATPTKPGRRATGTGYLREVADLAPVVPWFAIGGIGTSQVPDVVAAGVDRVVVVRALTEAADPGAAAATLGRALGRG